MTIKDKHEMVFGTLYNSPDRFFSIREIREDILENESTYIDVRTIVKSIDLLKRLKVNIKEKTERRGAKKVPVKVFAYLENENEKLCLE